MSPNETHNCVCARFLGSSHLARQRTAVHNSRPDYRPFHAGVVYGVRRRVSAQGASLSLSHLSRDRIGIVLLRFCAHSMFARTRSVPLFFSHRPPFRTLPAQRMPLNRSTYGAAIRGQSTMPLLFCTRRSAVEREVAGSIPGHGGHI